MVHGRSRGGCEATRQPLLVTAESNTAEPTPTHSWPSRHPSVDSVIHLRHVESKRRGSKRFHNFNPLALQRRTQPKYNAFSTAVYGPVTPYECTPASSHTSDGPKRTAAGAAGRINQSQGRCEGRKFRFQLLLCVYSTIQRAAK